MHFINDFKNKKAFQKSVISRGVEFRSMSHLSYNELVQVYDVTTLLCRLYLKNVILFSKILKSFLGTRYCFFAGADYEIILVLLAI